MTADTRILEGDCRDTLRGLTAESVHCVITSPPYWGLRDYGLAPSVWGGDPEGARLRRGLTGADDACDHSWGDWQEHHDERAAPLCGKSRTTERCYGEESRRFNENHQKHAAGAYCRDCGAWRGVLGLEPTVEQHLANIVEVFREVRRVLRPDGTLWLNYGDCYACAPNGRSAQDTKALGADDRTFRDKPISTANGARNSQGGACVTRTRRPTTTEGADVPASWSSRCQAERLIAPVGLKPKDLVGMPWRVALALQADGWWLRSDIIWHKPNPLPESVTDRPTRAHEYLFLLTKSERYFYDAHAIREPHSEASVERTRGRWDGNRERDTTTNPQTLDLSRMCNPAGRNKRSVWTIPTQPLKDAHYAAFPEKLVEPCVLAGTSERGVCPACGAPWERVVEVSGGTIGKGWHDHSDDLGRGQQSGASAALAASDARRELGWRPTCACPPAELVPGTCLDPFGGSGTVGRVANRLGRRAVLCELKPEYIAIAEKRTAQPGLGL